MEEVLPSASSECERLCSNQQRALVDCVDSIRRNNHSDGGTNNYDTSATATTMTAKTTCLPEAVMAWTRCCEEANLTGHEETWESWTVGVILSSFSKRRLEPNRLLRWDHLIFNEGYIRRTTSTILYSKGWSYDGFGFPFLIPPNGLSTMGVPDELYLRYWSK